MTLFDTHYFMLSRSFDSFSLSKNVNHPIPKAVGDAITTTDRHTVAGIHQMHRIQVNILIVMLFEHDDVGMPLALHRFPKKLQTT